MAIPALRKAVADTVGLNEVKEPAIVRRMSGRRQLGWSGLVGVALALAVAVPALANTDPVNVPGAGSRPMPAGELRLPGAVRPANPVAVLPVPGPLMAQIMTAESAVLTEGTRLDALNMQLMTARAVAEEARAQWQVAVDRVEDLRDLATEAAEEAYKEAAELRLFRGFGRDLRELSGLQPRVDESQTPSEGAIARELARAEDEERLAFLVYTDGRVAEEGMTQQHSTLLASFNQKRLELDRLKADNAAQLAVIEAAREAADRQAATRLGQIGGSADGKTAHPKALQALQFALAQRGKPYEWGAEGPSRYDCSGLVWDAYRSVGVSLGRVARAQYLDTRANVVPTSKLLPGDLLFFGTDRNDWNSIHHIGMYVGYNSSRREHLMVHAPRTGDVVKVSAIWWTGFFGATRVLKEVSPPPQPSPTPTRSSSPSPSPSPSPSSSPPPPPTTEPAASPTTEPAAPPATQGS